MGGCLSNLKCCCPGGDGPNQDSQDIPLNTRHPNAASSAGRTNGNGGMTNERAPTPPPKGPIMIDEDRGRPRNQPPYPQLPDDHPHAQAQQNLRNTIERRHGIPAQTPSNHGQPQANTDDIDAITAAPRREDAVPGGRFSMYAAPGSVQYAQLDPVEIQHMGTYGPYRSYERSETGPNADADTSNESESRTARPRAPTPDSRQYAVSGVSCGSGHFSGHSDDARRSNAVAEEDEEEEEQTRRSELQRNPTLAAITNNF